MALELTTIQALCRAQKKVEAAMVDYNAAKETFLTNIRTARTLGNGVDTDIDENGIIITVDGDKYFVKLPTDWTNTSADKYPSDGAVLSDATLKAMITVASYTGPTIV